MTALLGERGRSQSAHGYGLVACKNRSRRVRPARLRWTTRCVPGFSVSRGVKRCDDMQHSEGLADSVD